VKYLIFLMGVLLFARVNPFEPVIKPESQKVIKPKYFKKAEVFLPSDARILKKIIFVYQNPDSDIKQEEVVINKNIDFHSPIIITHNPEISDSFKKYKLTSFLTLYVKGKKILLKTKDKLIRKFFLVKPFRIVLDFDNDTDFPTVEKKISKTFLTKAAVGSHIGFYRVVLYFDSNYKFKVTKNVEGVMIECW